jgi:hypothetical protein
MASSDFIDNYLRKFFTETVIQYDTSPTHLQGLRESFKILYSDRIKNTSSEICEIYSQQSDLL